jgi:uncharacterized protein YegL
MFPEIRMQDLVDNPATRLPVCICLDVSPSMEYAQHDENGQTVIPIEELNEGVETFFRVVNEDPQSSRSAEVAIVTFDSQARVVQDFGPVRFATPPRVNCSGQSTNMVAGVELALSLLEKRKQDYKSNGNEYFQPWLVLITDGEPNVGNWSQMAQQVRSLVENKKLTVFPIGAGPQANLTVIRECSPKTPALRLKGADFHSMFEWLAQSVQQTSRSRPGQQISTAPLPRTLTIET